MTRSRLAAIAALTAVALPVTATGGEAPGDDYDADTTCKTAQRTDRDYVKARTEARKRSRGGGGRRGGAAAFEPLQGAKVINKLKDLTTSNGDNVVDGKDTDRTNDDGVAKTKLEFNNFGNYRLTTKVKVDGEVVATDAVDFGVADRESGKCDPVLPGAG